MERTMTAITITGRVTNAAGEPLYMAHVFTDLNNPRGTVTDIDGNFTALAIPGDTWYVSFVGMEPMQFVARAGRIDVTLSPNANLPEFEVTATDRRPLAALLLYGLSRLF